MEFAAWINHELDEMWRSAFHEAGHFVYIRHLNPSARIRVHATGGDGELTIHPEDFAAFGTEQKYAIAVAGCLGEAKGAARNLPIAIDQLEDVVTQIRDGLAGPDESFQVDVMIGGAARQSASNKPDFNWLNGAPELPRLRAAVAEVAAFFNVPANWVLLDRRAWKIALLKESDEGD